MSTTVTRVSDSATTTPELVLGYETRREARTVVHDLIGGGIAVTLVPPRPRSGTLEMLYPDEAAAWAGYRLHSAASAFALTSTERPDIAMTYVVTGHAIALDDETRELWVVSVDYQEIEP